MFKHHSCASDTYLPSSSSSSSSSIVLGTFLSCIETPCPLIRLTHGSPLYSTKDLVLEFPLNFLGQLEMADILTLNKTTDSKQVTADLLHRPSNQRNVISARHMEVGVTSTTSRGMSINLLSGRQILSHEEYIQILINEQPKSIIDYEGSGSSKGNGSDGVYVIISMGDEVPFNSSQKRYSKAIERTDQWFKELRSCDKINWHNTFLFGIVQGSVDDLSNVGHIARERIQDGANGIAIGGSGMGESIDTLNRVIQEIRASVGNDIPILVQGINTVEDIISAAQNGADVVSTNLPHILTTAGLAMCILGHGEVQMDNENRKKRKVKPATSPTYKVMNIKSYVNRTSSSPLQASCHCHACRHYTRAYIYHLYKAHELLGEVLLYTHNQWQLFELFRILRCNSKS